MLPAAFRARTRYAAYAARISLIVLCLSGAFSNEVAAQTTPPVMTSFRHKNALKELATLDWIAIYDQPPEYSRWWKAAAECAHVPLPERQPDLVQFFFVNARDFAPLPTDKRDRMVAGVTYAANEQIYVSVFRIHDEVTIKHEMMHQLLYWWGERNWDDDARPEFKQCHLVVV